MFKKILALFLVLFLVGCDDKTPPKIIETLDLENVSFTLDVGEEKEIMYTTNVEIVTFEVDDAAILSITNNVITALKVGKTFVTVKAGELSKTINVVVATVINLDLESLEMIEGETYELGATSKAPLEYSSSDQTVATVSENGLITALKSGQTELNVNLVDDKTISKTILLNVLLLEEGIFKAAKEKTESLKNYTLKMTIKELGDGTSSNESVLYYKFDGNKFEFSNTNMSVFYEKSETKTFEYKNTLDGYVKSEVVEELPRRFIPFYFGIEYENLDYLNEAYFVKYGEEKVFDSLKTQLKAVQISNIKLVLNEYYETVVFNVVIGTTTYNFVVEFLDINTTKVELPNVK